MNQVNNLIQWKNLTQGQKADFNFENYKYEVQNPTNTTFSVPVTHKQRPTTITDFGSVYRLVIEDDKWYTTVDCDGYQFTSWGDDIDDKTIKYALSLRPARSDEIPQPEKTLEQKIQDKWPDKKVAMLFFERDLLRITYNEFEHAHIISQSMKGFHSYVYEIGGSLERSVRPVLSEPEDRAKSRQPVAVLFEE